MTVRAWFTISALVLAALAAAFVFRLFASAPAPDIRIRAGDVPLAGSLAESCWPGRGGELACRREQPEPPVNATLPPRGTFRIVVTYPAQPSSGEIRIDAPGRPSRRARWKQTFPYELDPGTYTLSARANYPERAFVRYVFRFTVTRGGS